MTMPETAPLFPAVGARLDGRVMRLAPERAVAALCVAPNSGYKQMTGVECYDMARDARTFAGGMPVVAHPPCRAWCAYTAHQAKPAPGEKELGLLCAEWLRREGGARYEGLRGMYPSACVVLDMHVARLEHAVRGMLATWDGESEVSPHDRIAELRDVLNVPNVEVRR